MKKVHLAVRSESREHVQSLIREALEPGFKSMAQGLFRSQVESMFDHALQAELAEHLGRTTYERNGQGPWRNGIKPVPLPSPTGALSVEKPVLRKGGFRSSLLSLLRDGMDQAIEVICQRTWLRGLSTRAVASDISEMTDKLLPSIDQWRQQPIVPVRILYLDALYVPVRRGGETSKQAVLVAIGVDRSEERRVG